MDWKRKIAQTILAITALLFVGAVLEGSLGAALITLVFIVLTVWSVIPEKKAS